MPFPVFEAVPVARSTSLAAPDEPSGPEEPPEVDGVPDISAEWYRAVLDGANAAPGWLRDFAVLFTEAGVVVLGLLMVFGWWRARRGPSRAMAAALLTPAATVLAYATSEVAKIFIQEDRPCRAVPGARPLTECPELGDWSFPSNHSTIAGGAAMAVFLCQRGALGAAALALGALVAFSRVVVGVHYPHDVVVGFLLGVAVVAAAMALASRWVTQLVERFRPRFALILGPGVASAPDAVVEADDRDDRAEPKDRDDGEEPEDDAVVLPDAEDETRVLSAVPPSVDTTPTRPIPRTPHWPTESAAADRQRRHHPPRPPRAPRAPRPPQHR